MKIDWSSLKTRLIATLLMSTMIPLILLGAISYLALQTIFHEKIQNGIQNALSQTRTSLENTLSNMEYASLQLSQEGTLGQSLSSLLSSQSVFEQLQITTDIQKNMNLVNFTNPYLGVMLYYFTDEKKAKFQTREIRDDFAIDSLPLLSGVKGGSYYGPHQTAYKFGRNTVFSLSRPINVPGVEPQTIFVYIETNLLLFEEVLNKHHYGMNASHILLNQDGKIAYSDAPLQFPSGVEFPKKEAANGKTEEDEGFYLFRETSAQGWSIVVAVDKSDFEKEFRAWLLRYGGISLACLAISISLALLVWRTVYRPIRSILKEIRSMAGNRFDSGLNRTNVREFDSVLYEFDRMRIRIGELFAEIEQKERTKGLLEVEKLLHQINPHFIHNTLNTIQWIARMNGQHEIDRLVSIFTRVLHYNLGKEGAAVKLREELGALKDYVELQRIRYDYQFDVRYDVDEALLDQTIPRFILQPIVENALYHGLRDEEGVVVVRVAARGSHMNIEVKDNGAGMTEEEVSRLMTYEKEKNKAGLGIGLSYVVRMIGVHYGDHGRFQIESRIGEGTVMTMTIPLTMPGDDT
ncbi:cache domain-containing sensor histidine kinase [Paenibacillus contaminans]|uniref:histidine kinase n=1 Tax=Paenibacillus contaminans TaxID=450362 RepID=A0A329M0Z2_9BACL|nr:sensor histidine kinase [Paenibacillus contaminans]RAV13594.1 sensor histidine kinase [Paenibacillus contaminans]